MTDSQAFALSDRFPHVDMLYVRRNMPSAVKAAERYNDVRRFLDVDDASTIATTQKAYDKLMAAVAQ